VLKTDIVKIKMQKEDSRFHIWTEEETEQELERRLAELGEVTDEEYEDTTDEGDPFLLDLKYLGMTSLAVTPQHIQLDIANEDMLDQFLLSPTAKLLRVDENLLETKKMLGASESIIVPEKVGEEKISNEPVEIQGISDKYNSIMKDLHADFNKMREEVMKV
jgi:hypothetical protein